MSETRASVRQQTFMQKSRSGRSGRGGGTTNREFSLDAGIQAAIKTMQGFINDIGRFINKDGRMGSFDFLGSPGTFLYQNRNYAETIASGVVQVRTNTASNLISVITLDTESAASTDDLDTLTFFPPKLGNIVVLRAADDARTVVCKDGTGNLALAGDFSLTHTEDTLTLLQISDGSFLELSRSDNAA